MKYIILSFLSVSSMFAIQNPIPHQRNSNNSESWVTTNLSSTFQQQYHAIPGSAKVAIAHVTQNLKDKK